MESFWPEKLSHFDLKNWVILTWRPGKLSHFALKNWVILTWKIESFWPEKLMSKRLNLRSTWKIESFCPKKLRHFDLKNWVILTWKIESFWHEKLRHFDMKNWAILTWRVESLAEFPGRILVPPVTQFFTSKWLHFFFQWTLQYLCNVRFKFTVSLLFLNCYFDLFCNVTLHCNLVTLKLKVGLFL